jgi:hypothetical protein
MGKILVSVSLSFTIYLNLLLVKEWKEGDLLRNKTSQVSARRFVAHDRYDAIDWCERKAW